MNIFKNRTLRWVLLTIGLCSIIILTGMNVYSLYNLRDNMVNTEETRQIEQVQNLTSAIRLEMIGPFRGINQMELEPMERVILEDRVFPKRLQEKIEAGYESPIYTDIYFTPENVNPCEPEQSIYLYDHRNKKLIEEDTYPAIVCDGVGLVRTKAKIQLNDFEYRWNNIIEFETHRSFNIALLNLSESRVIGYITAVIDPDYVVDEVISPLISDYFGKANETGTVVWLRDWARNEILASSDPTVTYDRELVNESESFPGLFDNWILNINFQDLPVEQAYTSNLIKNLVVLGVGMVFVFGAMIFMFLTAQRERELSQRQAEFIANVTHELKTPLAVMQAAGENIQDGRVTEPDRLQNYGRHIYNESIRLRSMIEKLLDVAKVDSGQAVVKPVNTSLNELLAKYLDENTSYLKEKGFEVTFESADADPYCMVDPDSLETVINNLTENAVKYSTDNKYIGYKVFVKNDRAGLIVEDHGVGIPKHDLNNIFKKFYRVEDTLIAKTKGHGLGLSIVKNMVELNNGHIKVESSVGKGSKFIVTFPVSAAADTSESTVINKENTLETV
ncbi:sensor histidine kinase [Balneola sp. MJW-20]|uniref:sensor histidine kinase n=1 Tax=Gracilimonas aurantiaca TaxID=3234185 RepID=UPI00346663BC